MKNFQNKVYVAFSALNNSEAKMITLLISVALFVLSAAAPNATIGIGK